MMNSMRILSPVFLISLLTAAPAVGADGLVVASSVVDSRYCLGPNGGISLKLRVDFTYRNIGDTPVVLPRFSRLSGYTVFRDDADLKAQKATARISFRLPEIFHTLMVDPSKPSPLLFESIPPGGTAGRIDEVSIPLTIPGKDGPTLLGTSPLVQFTLDNWPGDQHIAEARHVWEPLGILWASQDTPPAVRLKIESNPVPTRCFPRVD
jgi:hypothetical protein